MGWRGGETPLAILFFFLAKSVTFPGVFFIDVIYFQKFLTTPLDVESRRSGLAMFALSCRVSPSTALGLTCWIWIGAA